MSDNYILCGLIGDLKLRLVDFDIHAALHLCDTNKLRRANHKHAMFNLSISHDKGVYIHVETREPVSSALNDGVSSYVRLAKLPNNIYTEIGATYDCHTWSVGDKKTALINIIDVLIYMSFLHQFVAHETRQIIDAAIYVQSQTITAATLVEYCLIQNSPRMNPLLILDGPIYFCTN